MIRIVPCAVVLFFAGVAATFSADVVSLAEQNSDVFAGREAIFHVTAPAGARVVWQLAMGGHTVDRGEHAAGGNELRLPIPDVKDGVIAQATLAVSLLDASGKESLASTERVLWIFPEGAFAGKQAALKSLPIHLFDPSGDTAAIFKSADIPCRAVAKVDALAATTSGVVVVGAGTSWSQYKGLPDVMVKLAEAGIPVLCLGPAAGAMTLPGAAEGEGMRPAQLSVSDGDFVRKLDKKLDLPAALGSIRIASQRGDVQAEVTDAKDGWMFLEADYGKASLVLCTADIIGAWDTGPAPRFLLARLIDHLIKETRE